MKKLFGTLILIAALIVSNVSFAAYKETVVEGADIGAVKRLAVALPMHYKTEDTEPSLEDLTSIMFNASRVARCYVISYDEIAANIQRDNGVDIKTLGDMDSRKIYDENVGKYADAQVTVTTANNGKNTQFFFEVRNAASNEFMYVYTLQSREIGKDLKGYTKACENFYKAFDAAAEKSIKDAQKSAKKK